MKRANLRELRSHESYPSLSILLPTHRVHPDNQQDPIRLKNLLDEARQRLDAEVGKRPSWPLIDRVEALAAEIDWQTNEEGLALFASEEFGASYRLPFPVEERVAVDRTFETRALLHALHHTPRYRALSLAEEATRLFEGAGRTLEEVTSGGFPISWKGPGGVTRRPDGAMMQRSNVRQAHLNTFFGEVDGVLAKVTDGDPLPLILFGTTNTLASYDRLSSHRGPVVARIEGSYAEATAATIARMAWPRLQEWLDRQRQAVIAEVASASGAKLLAAGIEDAWRAAWEGRGARLVVEEDYRQSGILHGDGAELELLADDVPGTGPSHADDAVDELIELVLDRGGEVAFVDNGQLAEYGRLALILRY